MKALILITALAASGLAASPVLADGDKHHATGAGAEHHAAASGKPGKVNRTVAITMDDMMRFTPSSVAVKKGETIRFAVKNDGKLKHEMVLGSVKELKEHAALMQKFPEMEHADPNQVSVDPGKTGELIWQFTKAGTFNFACLQPGHFEAGMKGTVAVR